MEAELANTPSVDGHAMEAQQMSAKTIWRNNGLSITLLSLFVVFLAGQSVTRVA
jgi:hypothetical protein